MKKRYLSVLTAGLLLAGGVMTANADVTLMPNFNGTASTVTDLVVIFDARTSTCNQITYTVFENFVDDVSCVAGVCANDGTVSCSTFNDCRDSCVPISEENATCFAPDGTDTGLSCVFDADCRGPITFDKDNPIITPLACSYTWDVTAGTGTVTGGTGPDLVTVQYDAPGTYLATMTMSVDDPENPGETLSASRTTQVTPVDLPDPVIVDATISVSYTVATCGNMTCSGGVNDTGPCSSNAECLGDSGAGIADGWCVGVCVGGTKDGLGCDGMLAADELPGPECPGAEVSMTITDINATAGLARAYVNWGDRSRTTIYDPKIADSRTHTYSRDGNFNIHVKLLDYDRNKGNVIVPVN